VSVAAVRSQVVAQLLAVGGLLRESAEPAELIRQASHSPVHLEVAVGVDPEVQDARRSMERTRLEIVAAYQLEGKARIDGTTGYTAMLATERAMVGALRASSWGAMNPRLASLIEIESRHETGPDGWIWIVVTATALHPYEA
jgi:hypothetical protein